MMLLRDYQNNAVIRLLGDSKNLLSSGENEICVFQAPTGSGKTIVMAEFLKRFIKLQTKKFSFIWVSVRKLHDQSRDKLENYYENDRLLVCSYFEDLQDNKIRENEILFINWHSINKKDINIYIRDNEQDNNLNSIVKNTKEDGRQIILIIDESHHTAHSDKSKELIEIISPKITFEVSATPHLKENVSAIVKINLSDVKEEEMIKTEISVNPEFNKIKIGSKSADELVIEQSLKKREELLKMYQDEKTNVNPLVLIQLPDKKESLDDKKDEILKILKNKFNITEDNGKLAIWLSEDKSDTLPNIEKNDNDVEVLIFKQAIALGWDCPRASILLIFRESKSFTFTIQTIGRIMRMPEQKHYVKHDDLNKAFVFTNLKNIEITEDFAKDYVTVYESKRKSNLYTNISLKSIHLRRQRERTRLSGEFAKIFMKVASQMNLREKITLKPSKIVNPVISDGRIINIDKTGEVERSGTVDIKLTEKELQRRFDEFVTSNCTPYAPGDSSDRMKTALYQFFTKEWKFEKYDPQAQKIILGKENIQLFIDCINLSKEQYKTNVIQQINEKREIEYIPKWEIPPIISYNSRYQQQQLAKVIMDPFYVKNPSEPEQKFMQSLSQSSKINWWFKNGETEIKYFAVLYKDENGVERGFYVDFIVMFKNGSMGLFDTKSGITAKDAVKKAEGLQKYISKENKSGKNLIGGILIHVNGSWLYNDEKKYHYDPENLSNWKVLSI